MREHGHAAGRLSRDGDVARVAPERRDVGLYPAQRRLLVHQAVVAGRATGPRGERRVGQEAERAQPVVDRDDDDARRRELRGVVVAAGILGEAAAVDPHEHRPPGVATHRRRGDVEVEAVLGEGTGPREPARLLRAACRVLRRVTHAPPRSRRPRCAPPQITGRRSCVGQPAEGVSAGDGDTADGAGVGRDDRGAGAGGAAGADGRGAGRREGQRGQRGGYRCEQRTPRADHLHVRSPLHFADGCRPR